MRVALGIIASLALVVGLTNGPVGAADTTAGAGTPLRPPLGNTMNVEVYGVDLDEVVHAIGAVDGFAYGRVPGHLLAASIGTERLAELEADPRVTRVTRLTRMSSRESSSRAALATSSALSTIVEQTLQLDQWHSAGYKGAGQAIGILDLFGETELSAAIAAGRLPQPTGTFCLRQGSPCGITDIQSAAHGVGVAEIVHAAAPEADLFLATVFTLTDLSAAIEWFAEQGVTVVNRSETSEFDGPGDGTGPVGSLVDAAVASDMIWVNAAGNAAGSVNPLREGENWIGAFTDEDEDGIHEWANGDERMRFSCGFLLGMRWDDWDPTTAPTDYDLAIYDDANDTQPRVRASAVQSLPSDLPLERIDTRCKFSGDADYLEITKAGDAEPDGVDQIQIMGNSAALSEWVNPGSATGPGAESANPGAITVGATVSPASFQIARYSSQGPTTDGRMNPDLVGPSCLPVSYFTPCFSGTSASAPFVSGVLAVLRGAGVVASAVDADTVIPLITIDQGPPGPDSMYGHGALSVPPPDAFGIAPVGLICQGLQPTIAGTDGPDILEGTEDADIISGGDGDDIITGRGGADIICGGDGRDVIRGGRGGDTIEGNEDRDRIWGEQGADVIVGGPGGDHLFGNVGADEIRAEGGNDRAKGGAGHDTTRGGAGRDLLIGGPGDDVLNGGASTDRCFGAGRDEAADDGDQLSGCEG